MIRTYCYYYYMYHYLHHYCHDMTIIRIIIYIYIIILYIYYHIIYIYYHIIYILSYDIYIYRGKHGNTIVSLSLLLSLSFMIMSPDGALGVICRLRHPHPKAASECGSRLRPTGADYVDYVHNKGPLNRNDKD
jgi:hypothetical protein